MIDKYGALKKYFGYDSFRRGQEELIDAVISGRDCLGIMPTGAGKSICYQIPALVSEGVTLVVSPLISLMKDQVGSLVQNGVRAAYLNSSLTPRQYMKALDNMADGVYKIVYVAPERLSSPEFYSVCSWLDISLIAVDEAHCVSHWGQDFRPSYLKIADFVSSLRRRPTVCAFTATATGEVGDDIIRLLALRDPFVITTGFDRPNLRFISEAPSDKKARLLELVHERRDSSGIVYCATRKNVEEIADYLTAKGFPAAMYHAGLPDDERARNQDEFVYDKKRIIVATNAFGMGIDKSNVSFVIHYNMPKNLESYYQEAGRAGRDGGNADCILLYSPGDVRTNRFLIENSEPNENLTEDESAAVRRKDLERGRRKGDTDAHILERSPREVKEAKASLTSPDARGRSPQRGGLSLAPALGLISVKSVDKTCARNPVGGGGGRSPLMTAPPYYRFMISLKSIERIGVKG